MDVRASRGIVKNYNQPQTPFGIQPPNDYKAMESMWKRDEVIATAFDTTVDMTTRNGYDFVAKTGDKTLSAREKKQITDKFSELNFSEILDNLIYQMITYGDAFLELRRKNGTTISELHPLETTEMRINYNQHGVVENYTQIPRNYANPYNRQAASMSVPGQVNFNAKDVIHFRMKWMGSRIYSETPLEPVSRIWATKQNSFNYLDQMFMNLRPELFIHLKGASKEQYDQAVETIWRAKTQPGRPIITYGKTESATDVKEISANFGNTQGLFDVLEYLREAVLMITRVPPVWVGLVNRSGANKGNSEAQIFSFETRIRKIQSKIENVINLHLLPALGYNHIEFNFNPISFKSEKEAIQNAAVLSSMNVKPQGIIKFLKRNGITDVEEEDFRTPEEYLSLQNKTQSGDSNQTARNKVSPSRQPSDKQSVKSNIDQTGSSEAGSKKLEEQSMQTRSTTSFNMPEFGKFPYSY